jgi:type IV secretory pathway VirB3-like protein
MIRQDALFKGATRPALLWGVPIPAFILSIGIPIIIGMWGMLFGGAGYLLIGALALPILLVCRAIVAKDDQQFRLLGLWLRFRLATGASRKFWHGTQTYAPWEYKRK